MPLQSVPPGSTPNYSLEMETQAANTASGSWAIIWSGYVPLRNLDIPHRMEQSATILYTRKAHPFLQTKYPPTEVGADIMAALSFRITHDDVSPALTRMAAAARRPEPIFRAMGTTFLSLTQGNKDSAYRPASWPAKKDGTQSTLQKSGTLSSSFHLSVSNTGATVSNPMVHAAIHQFGSKGHIAGVRIGQIQPKKSRYVQTPESIMSGSKGIPPRPFFPVVRGKFTPNAEQNIRAAGERVLRLQVTHST